jgi:hypothetical protein
MKTRLIENFPRIAIILFVWMFMGTSFGATPDSAAVVRLASFAPATLTNCLLLSSNATLQTYAVPVSADPAVTNLQLVATASPAIPVSALPPDWSVNGVAGTNVANVDITATGIFTNVCTAGASAVTNVIIVTEPPQNRRLGHWRFDDSIYTGDEGQLPVLSEADPPIPDWSGNAVSMSSTETSQLVYNTFSTNGDTIQTNVDCAHGTVRFWYQPNWSTGSSAPPNARGATFFRVGSAFEARWGLQTEYSGGTNVMEFATASNQYIRSSSFTSRGLNGVPIDFQAGHWYQITLAYTATNIALYTNGTLLACGDLPFQSNGAPVFDTGNGVAFYPSTDYQEGSGFAFGCLKGQPCGVDGQLDELETFDDALTPQAVSAGFPCFPGSTGDVMQDTYYVGRSDMLQTFVDGYPPSATNPFVVHCRLGYWRFDSDLLMSEQGQPSRSFNDIGLVPSWSETALNINSDPASQITYWDVFTNGWANINCREGTIRFWFKPNSVGGPGGPFIYLGSTNASDEWTLELTRSNTIDFVTQTNGLGASRILSASADVLSPDRWSQITLTYGADRCALYLNGVEAATGGGNTNWPRLANRNLGMVIGNTTAYNHSINGQFDELETFNYKLEPGEILSNFQTVQAVDSDLDGIPDYLEDLALPVSRPYLGSPVVVTGTVEAEQFDIGGPGIAYSNVAANPPSSYRPTGMFITNCDDLGLGYCLDQTRPGEWAQYTIHVLEPYTYNIETRVQGIAPNGVFECEFTNSSGFYTNTGPLTITTTNWANVSALVYLPEGTNIMRLRFLTAGTGSSYVGRFNYISIYPWWNAGFASFRTNSIGSGELSTNNDWADAAGNAAIIQSNINSVEAAGGGTVLLPAGSYFIAQLYPNETNTGNRNAAVIVTNSNVEIAGAGKTNTALVAYNRATTIFYVGRDTNFAWGNQYACSNFTLRDLTLQAQPHLAVQNVTNTTFELGAINQEPPGGTNGPGDIGYLTIFSGIDKDQTTGNILITNCQFLYGNFSIGLIYAVSNCLVTHCDFKIWGGSNVYTRATNASPTNTANTIWYGGSVGIWGAESYNVTVLENSYEGNENVVSSTDHPFGYVTTNIFQMMGPDGFVLLQSGGNFFVARNHIVNNALEGIELGGGPCAVVQNVFYTLLNDTSCCALAAGDSGFPGFLNNLDEVNYSFSFIGNQIYGDRCGQEAPDHDRPYSLNFSGNELTLDPPLAQALDLPGAAVAMMGKGIVNVCGNTLHAGGHGILFGMDCGHATILNNDFAHVTYRGIGMLNGDSSLRHATVINNILGEGSTFHVQLPLSDSFGWFLYGNQYVDSSGASIPPFFDPVSSAAHLGPRNLAQE